MSEIEKNMTFSDLVKEWTMANLRTEGPPLDLNHLSHEDKEALLQDMLGELTNKVNRICRVAKRSNVSLEEVRAELDEHSECSEAFKRLVLNEYKKQIE